MKTIFATSLPTDISEKEFIEMFAAYGRVRASRLAQDPFSGRCRGFGTVDMEGHEARAAIVALNGKELRGSILRVKEEQPRNKRSGGGHAGRHGRRRS